MHHCYANDITFIDIYIGTSDVTPILFEFRYVLFQTEELKTIDQQGIFFVLTNNFYLTIIEIIPLLYFLQ